jgi:hypothetical protein
LNTPAERGAATRNQVADKVAGVDAIEIKVTIPDAQVEPALSRYGLTVDNDEERYIYFFDTPDLALFRAGMIARARCIVGDSHDSTVKFRPVVPGEVPQSWRAFEGFKLEADASETGVVKSASLTMPATAAAVRSSAASMIRPCCASPSPRRVNSARSVTVRQRPSPSRSPMWNLIELVPASMTA